MYIHTHTYIHTYIYIFHGLRQFSGGWVGGCMYMVSWGFLNRKWVSTCLGYFYIFMWENMDAMDAKDVGMMAGWVPVISRGSQFLRYDGLMGFKLDLSTLIYQVKYHPIPGFQYCWDGNRWEQKGRFGLEPPLVRVVQRIIWAMCAGFAQVGSVGISSSLPVWWWCELCDKVLGGRSSTKVSTFFSYIYINWL